MIKLILESEPNPSLEQALQTYSGNPSALQTLIIDELRAQTPNQIRARARAATGDKALLTIVNSIIAWATKPSNE